MLFVLRHFLMGMLEGASMKQTYVLPVAGDEVVEYGCIDGGCPVESWIAINKMGLAPLHPSRMQLARALVRDGEIVAVWEWIGREWLPADFVRVQHRLANEAS